MDWLFDRGIVFDILPNDETVEKIVRSDEKIKTLACLTYLEHEPEQENIPLWQIIFTLLVGAGGYTAAKLFSSSPVTVLIREGTVIAVGGETGLGAELAFLFIFLGIALSIVLATFHINRHGKHIAAWANSWSTAIKESAGSR